MQAEQRGAGDLIATRQALIDVLATSRIAPYLHEAAVTQALKLLYPDLSTDDALRRAARDSQVSED